VNKELSREFQHGLQEQRERRRQSAEQQAEQVADALDAYLKADASLRAAAAECHVTEKERNHRNDARAAFVKALVTFKGVS
jgi:enamine deaminase RidA (YjgF/YER057c/UK114 family)